MKELIKQFRKVETVAAVIFYLLCIFIYGTSLAFPDTEWRFGGSPAFYPRILALLLFIFATALLWEGRTKPVKFIVPDKSRILLQIISVVLLLAMPTLMLEYLGFRISATLFLFVIMLGLLDWRLDKKRLAVLIASAVITMYVIYVAFGIFANVRLPEGVLF